MHLVSISSVLGLFVTENRSFPVNVFVAKRYHICAERKHNEPTASVHPRRTFSAYPGQRQLLWQASPILPPIFSVSWWVASQIRRPTVVESTLLNCKVYSQHGVITLVLLLQLQTCQPFRFWRNYSAFPPFFCHFARNLWNSAFQFHSFEP